MKDGSPAHALERMLKAAQNAISFIDGLSPHDFLSDERTQQAVAMSLIIIGEMASTAIRLQPQFLAKTPQIPWERLRGMRNRIAHGYDRIDFTKVWSIVNDDMPVLVQYLPAMIAAADAAWPPDL